MRDCGGGRASQLFPFPHCSTGEGPVCSAAAEGFAWDALCDDFPHVLLRRLTAFPLPLPLFPSLAVPLPLCVSRELI